MLLQIIQDVPDKSIPADDDQSSWDAHHSLKIKIAVCSAMMRLFRTLREESELILKLKGYCPGNKIPKGILIQGSEAIRSAYERYSKVKNADSSNEIRPK